MYGDQGRRAPGAGTHGELNVQESKMWTEDVRWRKDCCGGSFHCEFTSKIVGDLFLVVYREVFLHLALLYTESSH